jgi:hypothetical protein
MAESLQQVMVSYDETASLLKCTVRTVYGYCRLGLLKRAKLPGFVRSKGVTRQSLSKLLDQIVGEEAVNEKQQER